MKIIKAAALAMLVATPATAGGFAEPIVSPEVIEEDTASTSANILIPILLLILVAAAISGGSDGGTTPVPNGPTM